MTEKKAAANRRNALKSTGPRTQAGKAASSRNAVKHGIFAITPVLPGLENEEAWDDHRAGIFKSLAPVGSLEELLTLRIAIQSWRLWRVVRYEAEAAAAAVATAEPDLEARAERGSGKPPDPARAGSKTEKESVVVQILQALPDMKGGEKLDIRDAVTVLHALWEELPQGTREKSVPGIPDDESGSDAVDRYTAGLLRKDVEAYAAAAKTSPETLVSKAIASAGLRQVHAREEERQLVKRGEQWELQVERERRGRILLEPDILDRVARYESWLERSLYRTLHELQELQKSRSRATGPPPATAGADPTVNSKAS